MYEYRIVNLKTNEENVIFGRTYIHACQRRKLDPADYEVVDCEYVD